MRLNLLLLAVPCLLVSCIPENSGTQSGASPAAPGYESTPGHAPSNLVDDRLRTQNERIGRLETELHEMRLLFTNQLKFIEEVVSRQSQQPATAYQPNYQPAQQPQQVVIMPNNPVVTHRWDQQRQQVASAGASNRARGYQVQSGDTLSQIAERHGVPTSSLLTANPGVNPLRLQIGQQLTIPSSSQAAQYTAQAQASAQSYTVQAGDTFSQIAERHGIGLSQLVSANPNVDPNRLRIGKKLTIPRTYQQPSSQPTGYASPPLRSIQREPQAAPQSTIQPQYKSNPLPPKQTEPTHKVLIKIPRNTSFGEIAENVGTDVDTLNRLNHCALATTSRIPANGKLYVPATTPARTGR